MFLPKQLTCCFKQLCNNYPKVVFTMNKHLTSYNDSSNHGDVLDDEDPNYTHLMRGHYLLPEGGHNVLLLQPARKYGNLRLKLGSAEQSLEEARALIDSLGGWKIIDEMDVGLRRMDGHHFFTSGNYELLTEKIHSDHTISSVFINWPMLSGSQLAQMQSDWSKAVYDRYTLVVQIFKQHAKTPEARLQVALAELPILRSRLGAYHNGRLAGVTEEYKRALGKGGESPLEVKRRLLDERERKLLDKLKKLEENRDKLKEGRRKRDIPLITVLGYTNAGKTSLIRLLTSDADLEPCDKLFATLDVTNHGGFLTNRQPVIFADTIGFLGDLPTRLLAAFRATLKECLDTDLVIHVIDVSHEFHESQQANVEQILTELKLPEKLEKSVLCVGTKIDRLSDFELEAFHDSNPNVHLVSTTTGEGVNELCSAIQESLELNLGMVRKRLKVSQSGRILSWLYSEATVEEVHECEKDPEMVLLDVVFTPASWGKYQAMFHRRC